MNFKNHQKSDKRCEASTTIPHLSAPSPTERSIVNPTPSPLGRVGVGLQTEPCRREADRCSICTTSQLCRFSSYWLFFSVWQVWLLACWLCGIWLSQSPYAKGSKAWSYPSRRSKERNHRREIKTGIWQHQDESTGRWTPCNRTA